MGESLLIARVLLAAVFALAGVTKILDPAGARRAVRDFGVPQRLAGPAALLLPLVELVTAVALVPTGSAWWGAVAALALLALFSAAIGVALVRGRRPDCHCFGQLASGPIGWQTLARNAALAAVAAFIVSQGRDDAGRSAVAWIGELSTAERAALLLGTATLALVLAEGWVLLQLVGQNGRLLLRLEGLEAQLAAGGAASAASPPGPGDAAAGLPVGAVAPPFSLTGLYGETLTLDALRASGKPLLLAFMDPQCGPCNALLPEIGRWQHELAPSATLVVISRGTAAANRAKVIEHGISGVLLQQDREVAAAYRATGTPSAVLVQADGTIAGPLAEGADQIRALVARIRARQGATGSMPDLTVLPVPAANGASPCPNCGRVHSNGSVALQEPAALAVGAPAPPLRLPDLDGRTVDLADYRGRETLVLFWDPACGFCQQLLPDLRAWEAERPDTAPTLLVVSTGAADENAAQGLRSTVVLDQGFGTGQAFAVQGTPSAVLVAADGTIAAPAAVGGPAVLALAGRTS